MALWSGLAIPSSAVQLVAGQAQVNANVSREPVRITPEEAARKLADMIPKATHFGGGVISSPSEKRIVSKSMVKLR